MRKTRCRSHLALAAALGCVLVSGCVTSLENLPEPVAVVSLTEPVCHDWGIVSERVSPEDLGYWGLTREQVETGVEAAFHAQKAIPEAHLERPATTFLRLSLRLAEVREEPRYSLNLLTLFTLGLWPYRTEYRVGLEAVLFGPKEDVAQGTDKERRILVNLESEATLVTWSHLFFVFYPPAYTDAGRAAPFLDGLTQVADDLCARVSEAFLALEPEPPPEAKASGGTDTVKAVKVAPEPVRVLR